MTAKPGRARIGTSGYQYDHWKGVFYPDDIKKQDWFTFYARHFDTVEINNTFYNLPSEHTFEQWRKQAPENFCYTLKFSRYGTHLKHLKDPEDSIGTFLAHATRLGDLMGPILVQLRPNWKVNAERLRTFLKTAPDKYRWAVEFRDESWLCEEIFSILEEHNAALCVHDMIEDHPKRVTADWVYLRFHGEQYAGSYSESALRNVAERIRKHLDDGRDVYAYFNNDAEGAAAHNAQDLIGFVNG